MNIARTRSSAEKGAFSARFPRDWKFIAQQFPAQQHDNTSDEILNGPRRVIPFLVVAFGSRVPSGPTPLRLFLPSQSRGMCREKNNIMPDATPRKKREERRAADDPAKFVLPRDTRTDVDERHALITRRFH